MSLRARERGELWCAHVDLLRSRVINTRRGIGNCISLERVCVLYSCDKCSVSVLIRD